LTSPTYVRARVRAGTTWSAIVEAQFHTPQDLSKLQLSEIMYNPPAFGTNDGDEVEFLELKNVGAGPLDLSGVFFSDGIQFYFPAKTAIGAGQFLVLARNATLFAARYPGAPLHGLYGGKLNNNGERLVLSHLTAGTLFDVTYNNAAPWAAEADNSGLSLQRASFTLPAANPVAWIAATPTPGGSLPIQWMDGDGDGIPDGWELAHDLEVGVDDSGADPDQDGLTNREEFLAGSDPHNAMDGLRLLTIETRPTPGGLAVMLGFEARSNKTYSVVHRAKVNTNDWEIDLNIAAASTNRFIRVTNVVASGAPTRFYRLTTPRLP
jgi:hypothetical protein